jgi:hypothetical protein
MSTKSYEAGQPQRQAGHGHSHHPWTMVSPFVPETTGTSKQPQAEVSLPSEDTTTVADSLSRREPPSLDDLYFTYIVSPCGVWEDTDHSSHR